MTLKRHFVKKGAKYVLLGASPIPEKVYDPPEWASNENATRFVLQKPNIRYGNQLDFLYNHLCNPDRRGDCHPKAVVTLISNIKCLGPECDVDTVRVVQVTPNLFYEYIPLPCVNQAYYQFPKKIVGRFHGDRNLCADPRRELASASCCGKFGYAETLGEKYWGETMTYKTAQARCIAKGYPICFKPTANSLCAIGPGLRDPMCIHDPHYWSTEPCVLKV